MRGRQAGAFPPGIRGNSSMSIVIMDTGIDVTHPALLPITPAQGVVDWNNKVVAWLDFDNDTPGQWASAFAALRQDSDIYRTAVVSISQGTSSSSYS